MDASNLSELVAAASAILTPLLPFLTGALTKGAEKVGEVAGQDVWNSAKQLWGLISHKLSEAEEPSRKVQAISESVATVITTQAADAEQQLQRYTGRLEVSLENLLTADPELARQVAQTLQQLGQQKSQQAGTIFNIGTELATTIIHAGYIHSLTVGS